MKYARAAAARDLERLSGARYYVRFHHRSLGSDELARIAAEGDPAFVVRCGGSHTDHGLFDRRRRDDGAVHMAFGRRRVLVIGCVPSTPFAHTQPVYDRVTENEKETGKHMKRLLLIAGLSISSTAFAWGIGGMSSYLDYQNQAAQTQLMQAQTQALQAYTACMQSTPGYCGEPPKATYAPPAPQPVYHQQTQCHQVCQQYGQYRYCDSQCY